MRSVFGIVCLCLLMYSSAHVSQARLPAHVQASDHLNSDETSVCLDTTGSVACDLPYLVTNLYPDRLGVRASDSSTIPTVCACANLALSAPVVRLDDTATLCALTPNAVAPNACEDIETGSHIEQQLVWHMSQIPYTTCPAAEEDELGPCGDPDATVVYSPVCVRVLAAMPQSLEQSLEQSPQQSLQGVNPVHPVHSIQGTAQTVLSPFLDAQQANYWASVANVSDLCTESTWSALIESATVACAARECIYTNPVRTQTTECTSACTSSTSDRAVQTSAYVCERDNVLSSSDACSDGVVFDTCVGAGSANAECPGDADVNVDTAEEGGGVVVTCFTELTCAETPADQCNGACTIEGVAMDGRVCEKVCYGPEQTYRREEAPCDAPGCGQVGTQQVTFYPCANAGNASDASDSANVSNTDNADIDNVDNEIGCLAYTAASNATVTCVAAPCPVHTDEQDVQGVQSVQSVQGVQSVYGKSGDVLAVHVDAAGQVCASTTLDIAGRCCSAAAALDHCGLCAREHYDGLGLVRIGYDVHGVCCSSQDNTSLPVLSGSLVCCQNRKDVDVCGVCGGDASTCELTVSAATVSTASDGGDGGGGGDTQINFVRVAEYMSSKLGVSVASRWDHAALPPGSGIDPGEFARVFMDSVQLSSGDGTRINNTSPSHSNGRALIASTSASTTRAIVRPLGIAGNGVCESGESADEEPVCEPAARACLALRPDDGSGGFLGNPAAECGGNGVCVRASQTCKCRFGYSGDTCSECAQGFSPIPTGVRTRTCTPTSLDAVAAALGEGTPIATIVVSAVVASLVAAVAPQVLVKVRNMRMQQPNGQAQGQAQGQGQGV